LEALLEQDLSQNQEELARLLGVTQQAISKRLKAMGMIQKQGNWVQYELKPRDVEWRLFACEQLLEKQRRKGFLHRIVTGDEKWVTIIPSAENHGEFPAMLPRRRPNRIFTPLQSHALYWDQLSVVYYELLKPIETITGDRYRTQLMHLSRALKDKRPQYNERHDKVIL